MSESLQELNRFISNTTIAYRKDAEEIKDETVNGIRVITINGYPEAPSRGVLVDVHFLKIGFSEAIAGTTAEQFLAMIAAAEHGSFADMTLERVAEGPSYIEYGGWLGSQDQALRFMALGSYYGLWEVVTPERLHAPQDMWDALAGNGLVMNSGLKKIADFPAVTALAELNEEVFDAP